MKIKTSLFYSLAAATLMGGVANAQNSATDPVGFHTINVGASAAVGARRISLVSAGLVNPIEYASGSTGIDATTVTVDGTPFVDDEYATVPEGTDAPFGSPHAEYNKYYVEVTSGPEEGAWANILSNTVSVLTVDRDLSAAGAEKIAIRRHISISDLFGAANDAGLGESPDGNITPADEIVLFANGSSTIIYYINVPGTVTGWFTSGLAPADETTIEPQQGVQVIRKDVTPISFTRSGHVKVGKTQLMVNPGLNVVANPRAVGIDDTLAPVFTLGDSNLYNTGGVAVSVIDSLDGNITTADEVTVFGDGATFSSEKYFRISAVGVLEGWFRTDIVAADDVVIENGTAFLVDRKSVDGFVWTVPAEDIAPPTP